ncbi:MAG: hypothetical protein LH473_07890, partial [Chitinophagales bacterium]|nr:hypothetical protein [Chitinophagales bacterium]
GSYGEATGAVANFGIYGFATATSNSINTYGVYGSASGTTGSVYAGYFAGKTGVSTYLTVDDSIKVNDALVVGTASRPNAYEFAVTGGADGYFGDKLSVQTTTATASLNVKGTNETILMEGTTPYMKLVDGTSQSSFFQASGNDLRIGTLSGNTSGKLIFRFNGTNKNAMDVNGNLGLGTTSPSYKLHVIGGTDTDPGSGGYIVTGSTTSTNISIDDNEIMARFNGAVSPLYLNNDGGDVILCRNSGNVLVGTTTPATGYIVSVNGKVMCEELKVQLSGNWPDFVFADDFKLPSLSEVEQSIQKNKHLPGIPSAKEINDNGIEVGEMQKLMMQKIEELTLYVIELQKQNTTLAQKVNLLETK